MDISIFKGNISLRNSELKYSENAVAFYKFSVAVKKRVKVNGQYQDDTSWRQVTAFGKEAERLADLLPRVKQVIVTCNGFEARPYLSNGNAGVSLEYTLSSLDVVTWKEGEEGDVTEAPKTTKSAKPTKPAMNYDLEDIFDVEEE